MVARYARGDALDRYNSDAPFRPPVARDASPAIVEDDQSMERLQRAAADVDADAIVVDVMGDKLDAGLLASMQELVSANMQSWLHLHARQTTCASMP